MAEHVRYLLINITAARRLCPTSRTRFAGWDQYDGAMIGKREKNLSPSGRKPVEPSPVCLYATSGSEIVIPRLLGREGGRDEAPVSNAGAQENARIGVSCFGSDGLADVCSLGPCFP